MKHETLQLNDAERYLLQRSSDIDISRRRLRVVIASGFFLVAALIVVAPLVQSWQFLLFFAVAYIAMTVWERVGYARTIVAYKGLVQKLSGRINELERGAGGE
jgi:hypothetical protein